MIYSTSVNIFEITSYILCDIFNKTLHYLPDISLHVYL